MKSVASAPGKLMLFGEHAVVYDYPCLVTAVDLRIEVTATLQENKSVSIQVENLPEPYLIDSENLLVTSELPKEVKFVAIAIKNFWEYVGNTFGVAIQTRSQFSHSYGLGSSSAVTVATMKALSEIIGYNLTQKEIFDLSYATVLDVQGKGSGFDVAAATYGGTLYYIKGGKTIRPLNLGQLPMVIGYTGIKASTTKYIQKVSALQEQFPHVVKSIMDNIEIVVNEADNALQQLDYQKAGQLMIFNQGLLSALGVSTDELNSLISATQASGAYGAKLSGAGGGDCIISFVSDKNREKVEAAIQLTRQSQVPKAEVISVRTGAEGVRIEG